MTDTIIRRSVKQCEVDGCERPHSSRGWCTMHYSRWRANGDPLVVKKVNRVPVIDGHKVCSRCKRNMPVNMYVPNAISSTGLHSHCNDCRAHGKRAANYGVTVAQYEAMLSTQDGRCAICRNGPGVNGLAVDHCHSTGRVRALLCSPCNSAIGLLREDPKIFASAVTYLQTY